MINIILFGVMRFRKFNENYSDAVLARIELIGCVNKFQGVS